MILLLGSCTVTSVLTSQYNKKNEFVSQKNYDDVWLNAVELFVKQGYPIEIIDKSSGVIVSSQVSFKNHSTFEKDGKPEDPNAWIVLGKLKNSIWGTNPSKINVSWNIIIKKLNSGETSVNINVVNIDAKVIVTHNNGKFTERNVYSYSAKSTGVFEKMIFNQIK